MRNALIVAALAISGLLSRSAFALTAHELQLAIAEGAAASDEKQVPEMIPLPSKSSDVSGTFFSAGSCWQAVRNWSFKRAIKDAKLDPEVARSNCLGRDFFQVLAGRPASSSPVTAIRLRVGKSIVKPVETRNGSSGLIAVFDASPVLNAKEITILASIDSGQVVEMKIESGALERIFRAPSN